MKNSKTSLLALIQASLMIAATAIGAGMLAIPLVTAEIGFKSAFFTTFLVWIFMYITGLLLMEVSISLKDKGGFIEMAKKYLPFFGKELITILFFFLYGMLLIAYVSAGSEIFILYTSEAVICKILFPILIGATLLLKSKVIVKIISILTIPMWVCFILFFYVGLPYIEFSNLQVEGVGKPYVCISVLFGAFGYHNVIPTVSKYLNYEKSKLRLSLFFGSFIPCIIYLLWQFLVLSIVDHQTLIIAKENSTPIVAVLSRATNSIPFKDYAALFAFFAIATSALGVGLSMVEFIKFGKRKINTFFVMAVPSVIAYTYPGIFLKALSLAGGVGESLLNGIIPVWIYRRYRMSIHKWSKSLAIFAALIFSIALFVTLIELYNL